MSILQSSKPLLTISELYNCFSILFCFIYYYVILQLIIYYYVILQLKVSALNLFPLLLARICLTERLACRCLRVRADGVSHFLSVAPLDSPFLLGHNRELHVVSSVCLASVFFCLLSLYSRTLWSQPETQILLTFRQFFFLYIQ